MTINILYLNTTDIFNNSLFDKGSLPKRKKKMMWEMSRINVY